MSDQEIITAYDTRYVVSNDEIDWMREIVKTNRPEGVMLPGWSVKAAGLDVAVDQVAPQGGILFSIKDLSAGQGPVAYTPDTVGILHGAEPDQESPESLEVVHAFSSEFAVPTQTIEKIQQAVIAQNPVRELPGWSVSGRVLDAGIKQTGPEGGIFVYVANMFTQRGDIAFDPKAAPLVKRVLKRKG